MAETTSGVRCAGHLDREAVALCDHCRQPVCRECRVETTEPKNDFCSENCRKLYGRALATKTCPRCSLEIPSDAMRCEYCDERVGTAWRAMSVALATLVIAAIATLGLLTWSSPREAPPVAGLLIFVSLLALAVGIVGRSRKGGAYIVIFVLLACFGGLAWLTRHPDTPWLAEAQSWPVIGTMAGQFRTTYLRPEPQEQAIEETEEPIEIVFIAPEHREASQPDRIIPKTTPAPRPIPRPIETAPVAAPSGTERTDSTQRQSAGSPEPNPGSTMPSPVATSTSTTAEIYHLGTEQGSVRGQTTSSSTRETDDLTPLEEKLEHAFDLLERNRADEAVKAFKKADKLADRKSAAAVMGLSLAYGRVGAYANAERTARRALELAEDPGLEIRIQMALGIAIFNRAGDDQERLEEAEAAFRAALELGGADIIIIKYNLGEVLLKLERDEEGLDFLEEYLASNPTGPNAARARSLVDDPRRARENLAPDFALVTLGGEYLTPEDLQGKVVLIDFWGTWCAPCREATPHLRRLNKRRSDQPFVMISVSNDADRGVLDRYIEEHDMDWIQVWDERGKVARDNFRVRTYPTFVIIDHEGRLALRSTGWGPSTIGALDRELGRRIRKAKKAAKH